jgi:hypothetical protein
MNGVLLLYNRPALFPDAATITDHIDAFGRYSDFEVTKLNTNGGFPSGLRPLRFDAIVLHYSLFASGPHPYLMDDGFRNWLRDSDAYKVAFFQDEHEYCTRRFAFLDENGVDCVYTCFAPSEYEATYGSHTNVSRLVSYQPAYVSPDMVAAADRLSKPDAERRIDVGYRTRPTPPYFGRGGVEKTEIGRVFAERAAGTGLRLDISAREEDRLYGDAWYEFLADCRGQLGTESGASCVDLEDEVREEYLRLSEEGPVTLEDLERGSLGNWDGRVELRTTSSRHFEAAAMRVCQIMFEGRYAGVLEADRHFLSLRKDFSNIDDVLERFRDPAVRAEITGNARRDLIDSGDYSYERFIAGFDRVLADAGLEAGPARPLPAIRGRPPMAVLSRHVSGTMFWLSRKHPRIERAIRWSLEPVVKLLRRWGRTRG